MCLPVSGRYLDFGQLILVVKFQLHQFLYMVSTKRMVSTKCVDSEKRVVQDRYTCLCRISLTMRVSCC